MSIFKRTSPGPSSVDPSAVDLFSYNNAAGARKSAEVGRHLLPFPKSDGAGGIAYTTDLSGAAFPLPGMGKNLAIYNNDTVIHAITLGEDNTVTALASGATDASGHVGIPCVPARWTYVACGNQNWAITESNKLLVFLIDDDTSIVKQSNDNAST